MYRIKEKLNYVGAKFHNLQVKDEEGWMNLHTITPKNLEKYISRGGTFEDSEAIIKFRQYNNL